MTPLFRTEAAWTISKSIFIGPQKTKSLPREEVRQAFEILNSDWEEECHCSNRRPLGGG